MVTCVAAGRRDNAARLGSRRAGDPLSLSLKLSPQWSGDITKSAPSPVIPCGVLSRSSRASGVPTCSESAVEKCGESIATRHTLPSTISASTVSRGKTTDAIRAGIPSAPSSVVSRTTVQSRRRASMDSPMRILPTPSSLKISSPQNRFAGSGALPALVVIPTLACWESGMVFCLRVSQADTVKRSATSDIHFMNNTCRERSQLFAAFHAIEARTNELLPCLHMCYPRPVLPGRIVTHVLRVPTCKVRNPVALCVGMEADDRTRDGRSIRERQFIRQGSERERPRSPSSE
jgi:hypothetical protein